VAEVVEVAVEAEEAVEEAAKEEKKGDDDLVSLSDDLNLE
jgi:hypothetical protein